MMLLLVLYIFTIASVLVLSDERANNTVIGRSAGLGIFNVTLLPDATESVTVPVVLAIFQQFAKLLLYELRSVPVNSVHLYH